MKKIFLLSVLFLMGTIPLKSIAGPTYGPYPTPATPNVVTNGAGLHYNIYVPAGLYDGSQNLGNSGGILTATGSGGVSWNNYMLALPEYSDAARLSIKSHNYGNGNNGSVSIGNIDAGGYAGNPNNGLVMNAQAGNTTISMDADTGYAQFGGGLITAKNTLDDGSGNMTVNTSANAGGLVVQGNVPNVSLSLYPTGTGGIKWQFYSTRSDSGFGGGEFIFNPSGYAPVVAYNANGGEAHGSFAGSPVPSSGALFDKISVGTTVADANLEVAGTMHSTDNYTNDATIFATAINEQAKDVAPHLTTSAATSGTVTASTSYWNETVYLSSGSTIASITIALPSSGTLVGQIYRIHTKSIVTTLSVTGGSFADTAVVALTAGQTIAYQAQSTSGAYIRIQ